MKNAVMLATVFGGMVLPAQVHSQPEDAFQEALAACIVDAAQQEGKIQRQAGSLEVSCSGVPAKTVYEIVGSRPERIERRASYDGAIHNIRYMKAVPPGDVAHLVHHCFERED